MPSSGRTPSTTDTWAPVHLQRCSRFRLTILGGGASKSQPRPTIAGWPIYLGERKPRVPTCRDEVVPAVEALVAGGKESTFSVEMVHAAMVSCGSRWPRETVAKTMLRMTRQARRPPYLQLERAGCGLYRVVPSRGGLGRSVRVSRYNTVVSEPDLWIEPTARRHGISDDDIRHALTHPGYVGDDPDALDEDTPMTLILGPDRAGNRLELAALVADDGTVVVVHAMSMRVKYAHLWPGERRSRP